MKKLLFVLLFFLFVCTAATRKKLVMYYANWTTEQSCPVTGNLTQAAADVDVIVYAFASINTTTGKAQLSDSETDVGYDGCWYDSNFYKLMRLKAQNPTLKILLSVGGWSYREQFKTIVDAGLLPTFAKSCVQLLTSTTIGETRYCYAGLFDGIDIDWEFDNGDSTGYAAAYVQLLELIKDEITASGVSYLLTVALQAGQTLLDQINVKEVSDIVSWISLVTYDFHGTWENTTNFNAPLYGANSTDKLCVDAAISRMRERLVPASKLLLGMSYVGTTYQGVPAGTTCGLQQSTTGPAAGIFGKYEAGSMYYKDIVSYLLSCANCGWNGYGYCWSSDQQASWLYNPTTQIFVSYESPASAYAKVAYVRNNSLAGVMCWQMCADTNGAALTKTIRAALDA